MRFLVVLALCALLGSCGLARRQEQAEQREKAVAAMKAGYETCDQTYPKSQANAVLRAKCLQDMQAPFRAMANYPDLFDQETATRNLYSEKWFKGQITQADFEFQMTQAHSQIVAEEQRRNLANRSVGAQEAIAAAAMSPTVCNRVGTTTICN